MLEHTPTSLFLLLNKNSNFLLNQSTDSLKPDVWMLENIVSACVV